MGARENGDATEGSDVRKLALLGQRERSSVKRGADGRLCCQQVFVLLTQPYNPFGISIPRLEIILNLLIYRTTDLEVLSW